MIADPQQLERLQNVTREYSRFSQTALGLAWIPFAILFPLCWRLSASLEPRPMLQVLLIAFGIWFLTRHLLRQRLYQRFGAVQEIPEPANKNFLQGLVTGLLIGAAIMICLKQFELVKIPWLDHIDPKYLAIIPGGAIGITRLFKRDVSSSIVLFALTASVVNGRYLNEVFAWQQVLQVLCVIGICGYTIFRGIQEHQQFKTLETQLESLRP
jgi:hypothetical protein